MNMMIATEKGQGSQHDGDASEAESPGIILFIGYHGGAVAGLEKIVGENGFKPYFFQSIEDSEISNLKRETIIAVITDSRYLASGSHDDWKKFKEKFGRYPIWAHVTDDVRPANIVEMMRSGLDEFVPASESASWIENYVKNINEKYASKFGEIYRAEHEATMLQKRVEWSNFKENKRKAWNDVSGREAIINLQTSLSQGAGFGLMLTLMEYLGMGEVTDGRVAIDPALFEKIKENARYTRRMLQGLAEYVNIFDQKFNVDRISIEQIEVNIKQRIKQFEDLYSKKKMRLRMSGICSRRLIEANIELIMMAFDELAVNAWKYSRRETDVTVHTSMRNGYYTIAMQSFPSYQENLDLESSSLEKLKLPFYRIHPPVEDAVEMERFVMGLGLPAVEQIASKMRGIFMLEKGVDYCGTSSEECFMAYLMIPLS